MPAGGDRALTSVVGGNGGDSGYRACESSDTSREIKAHDDSVTLFFNHIKTGKLAEIQAMLASDKSMSNCSKMFEHGYRDGSPRTIRAAWYALELACGATTVHDKNNYLQILKAIFDALKIYGGTLVYTGEEMLEYAPPSCCLFRTYHAGGFLHYAVDQDKIDVVRFLLENKLVDVNYCNRVNGHNALAFARSTLIVTELIKHGINASNKSHNGLCAADMVGDEVVRNAILARMQDDETCCVCAPCTINCTSCECSVLVDCFWWLRCC